MLYLADGIDANRPAKPPFGKSFDCARLPMYNPDAGGSRWEDDELIC
jgi:hypothetical protein